MLSEQLYRSVLFNSINNTAVKPTLSLRVRETLQRVWAVCSSSVRKSLQGLDNFSASGMEAVDAIEKLVDKLVDCGKTQQ